MSVYEQGEGEMESANNVNFLGPICHLSGSRSGGSFIIPTPAPPSPPTPPCATKLKCTNFSSSQGNACPNGTKKCRINNQTDPSLPPCNTIIDRCTTVCDNVNVPICCCPQKKS